MTRKILLSFLCFFSVTIFASTSSTQIQGPMCNKKAATSTESNFCATFPPAATCNCQDHVPGTYCNDMVNVYCSMLKTYGSLDKACENQGLTSKEECKADWNCYWDGGTSTFPPPLPGNQLCNANGAKCTTVVRPTLQTCPK